MRVADLVRAMETIAPSRFAADWDNVGLLVGDVEAPISRVMLAIDCTRGVLEEAKAAKAEAIVSYHPPLFAPQKTFVRGVAFEAARANIAIYSPHTAFDVADGGTNDVLADALGLVTRAPLRLVQSGDAAIKLVTFVPADHVDTVATALFAEGAGRVGRYSSCSFRSPGTGTFFGEEGTAPTVGSAGRLEHAAEVRLEVVVPMNAVGRAVDALRRVHPYEEPAFDLLRLAAPVATHGFGRVGTLASTTVRALVDRVKVALSVAGDSILVAGPVDREVTRAAVCAGSGAELLKDAIASGAQLFLTGELRHHDALQAVEAGLTVFCTRHSTSERSALMPLEVRLASLLPGLLVSRSQADSDPFTFI